MHNILSYICVTCRLYDRIKPNQQNYTRTINKLLLSSGDDAAEVGTVLSAVFLCILPGVSVGEVPVGQRSESGYENTYFIYYAARQV